MSLAKEYSMDDQVATQAFAQQWSLPLDPFGRILEHDNTAVQNHTYMKITLPNKMNGQSLAVSPEALHIRQLGRFSNGLIQIAQSIELAQRLNINHIYLSPCDRALEIFEEAKTFEVPDTGIFIHLEAPPNHAILLEGEFFYSHRHDSLFPRRPDRARWIQAIRDHTGLLCNAGPCLESDALVAHVRSGDIFEACPHSGYGQPPLAFYLSVVDEVVPQSVHLVYENTNNPIIAPLRARLRLRGFNVLEHSSALRDDVSFLLRAKVMVAGRGTFIPGVLALSSCIETIYTFDQPLASFALSKTTNRVIKDRIGIYRKLVLQNNWKNTGWQRELMKRYPQQFLGGKTGQKSIE